MLRRANRNFQILLIRNSKRTIKKVRKTSAHYTKFQYTGQKIFGISKVIKHRLNSSEKLSFFLGAPNCFSSEAYRLFSMLEMQISSILLRSQLVPFFFMVPDLCFYRLVFLNGRAISNPFMIVAIYDSVQLPIFIYQLMNYRQNRFYYYPKYLRAFFKTYWGQFIDYTSDKIWILSNAIISKISAQVLPFVTPNILLYMSPFRRFSKLYYRSQPERLRGEDSSLMYTHTVFKIKIFNYILFYK